MVYEGIEKLAALGSHRHAFKVFVVAVATLEPASPDSCSRKAERHRPVRAGRFLIGIEPGYRFQEL